MPLMPSFDGPYRARGNPGGSPLLLPFVCICGSPCAACRSAAPAPASTAAYRPAARSVGYSEYFRQAAVASSAYVEESPAPCAV